MNENNIFERVTIMSEYIVIAENNAIDGMNILFDTEDCIFRSYMPYMEMSLETVLYALYNQEYDFWHIEELSKAIKTIGS